MLVGLLIVGVGCIGGFAAADGLNGTQRPLDGSPTAVSDAPSDLEVYYQGRLVGHVRSADLVPPLAPLTEETHPPYYPQIGFSVYADDGTLVGYATESQGYIPLDEVERYKADPAQYPSTRTPIPDDQLPPGFEPLNTSN